MRHEPRRVDAALRDGALRDGDEWTQILRHARVNRQALAHDGIEGNVVHPIGRNAEEQHAPLVAGERCREIELLLYMTHGFDDEVSHDACCELCNTRDRIASAGVARDERLGRAKLAASGDARVADVDADDSRGAQVRQTRVEQQSYRPLSDDSDGQSGDAGNGAQRGEDRRHRLRDDRGFVAECGVDGHQSVVANQ